VINVRRSRVSLSLHGQALHQLYYDLDMAQKTVAQKWLTAAQASPQAWHFCWALLGPDKSPEVQFFGASTLHLKIWRHWADLPAAQHEDLKVQLVAHVARFAAGPKMVLTRLCVALASLVLRTAPDAWPAAVPDLLTAVQAAEGGAGAALLELLTVLPEELQSGRLRPDRRGLLRAALAGQWPVICPLLRRLLRQTDSPARVKVRALGCLGSWAELDVSLGESEALLQDSFSALADPELFDAAVEAIVSVLAQFVDVLVKLVSLVLGLQEQLRKAVQDGDMETSHGICRVAVALGETHCRTLLEQAEHWQDFQALVSMILFCTGIPGHYPVEETCSSLTLTFWYTLQDDVTSLEAGQQTLYLQAYRPVFFQLVDVLLHKSRFPGHQAYASWSAGDKEQFRIYRVDISDTLMYVYDFLGPELLRNMYDRLGRLVTDPELTAQWQDVEVLLFGFQSIAETEDVSYSDIIPGLIGLMPLIPVTSIQLADTLMFTIGSLGEWLADHPPMLTRVLPVVLRALSDPDLSVSSVSALKRICRECRRDLRPHAEDILAAAQEVLVQQIHKSAQCMWLMQALGFLLSAQPREEVLGQLFSLLGPSLQDLERLASEAPSSSNRPALLHILGLLTNLLSTFDRLHDGPASGRLLFNTPSPPDCSPVSMVSVFECVHPPWSPQAACAVFEKSLKNLLHGFGPLVDPLCELIGRMYAAVPRAPELDLSRQLFHIFHSEKCHLSSIRTLLELLTSVTLSIFQQGQCRPTAAAGGFVQYR
uniref:Importin-13 n=1 Tax=Denticeps clupeoides TaxID=299321 RepID=A0AAY4AT45_9TELE